MKCGRTCIEGRFFGYFFDVKSFAHTHIHTAKRQQSGVCEYLYIYTSIPVAVSKFSKQNFPREREERERGERERERERERIGER